MSCLEAKAWARELSRAATAQTVAPSIRRSGRISAAGAMRAAPRQPILTSVDGAVTGCPGPSREDKGRFRPASLHCGGPNHTEVTPEEETLSAEEIDAYLSELDEPKRS